MNEDLVKQLLEQNKLLMTMLASKCDAEMKQKSTTKDDILKTYEPIEISNLYKIARYEFPFTINDCEFNDLGFQDCCIRILKKIFSNTKTRPIHLCNKKTKSFYVFENNEWNKKNYGEASYYIKRILNCCILHLMKVIHEDDTKSDDWKDPNWVVICQPTDEHIDKIITQILDIFVIPI
jgi:hypothetical protein